MLIVTVEGGVDGILTGNDNVKNDDKVEVGTVTEFEIVPLFVILSKGELIVPPPLIVSVLELSRSPSE